MSRPIAVNLYLAGDVRGDHTFHIHVEESSEATWYSHRDDEDFYMPWLRAACSCGWADDRRVTLEENAHYWWLRHTGTLREQ